MNKSNIKSNSQDYIDSSPRLADDDDQVLDIAEKIGYGIGVGIASVAFGALLAAIFVAWKARKRAKACVLFLTLVCIIGGSAKTYASINIKNNSRGVKKHALQTESDSIKEQVKKPNVLKEKLKDNLEKDDLPLVKSSAPKSSQSKAKKSNNPSHTKASKATSNSAKKTIKTKASAPKKSSSSNKSTVSNKSESTNNSVELNKTENIDKSPVASKSNNEQEVKTKSKDSKHSYSIIVPLVSDDKTVNFYPAFNGIHRLPDGVKFFSDEDGNNQINFEKMEDIAPQLGNGGILYAQIPKNVSLKCYSTILCSFDKPNELKAFEPVGDRKGNLASKASQEMSDKLDKLGASVVLLEKNSSRKFTDDAKTWRQYVKPPKINGIKYADFYSAYSSLSKPPNFDVWSAVVMDADKSWDYYAMFGSWNSSGADRGYECGIVISKTF